MPEHTMRGGDALREECDCVVSLALTGLALAAGLLLRASLLSCVALALGFQYLLAGRRMRVAATGSRPQPGLHPSIRRNVAPD
ncbi:MAG: hypothetical protein AMXMBFR8_25660 [Nevskiales bacterium]